MLQEQLETLREKAAQADSAMKMAEKLQAEMALLQEQVETLHSRDNHVAELQEEVGAPHVANELCVTMWKGIKGSLGDCISGICLFGNWLCVS